MSEGFDRKLTAILSADAVGYSRLMGDDEAATVRTIRAYLEVMSTLIQHHRGRVVDTPGDNILAEFASVVDAVECALEVQAVLKSRNATLPDHRRMDFRIGINLGDVIAEGDRIYGDGVNIAARLEGMADPGGICISGTVYEHIRNKMTLWDEYLGKHAVKNIHGDVEVYRLLLDPPSTEVARPPARHARRRRLVTVAAPLVLATVVGGFAALNYLADSRDGSSSARPVASTARPTIAVLAFDNMSEDPAQEYFSDGIAEDLITDLSKVSGLVVMARNSSFAYKGQPLNIPQVGRELDVAYIVEGSVRQADGRVRINTQLVETASGTHVWADRYDRSSEDIFSVQDEVVARIVEALRVTLTPADAASLATHPTEDLGAYDHTMRGWWYYKQFEQDANEQARVMFTRALEADPEYSHAMTGLGFTYYEPWAQLWTQDPEVLERARELALASMTLDDSNPGTHTLLAHVYLWTRQWDAAITEQERAVELGPTDPDALRDLGLTLLFAGRTEEAIEFVERGRDLHPRPGVNFPLVLGMAYTVLGQYESAIAQLEGALALNPNSMHSAVILAQANAALGRMDEARQYVAQALAINPQITVEELRSRTPFRDASTAESLTDLLRQAGMR
jgi:adenylate cyclase